MSGTVFGHIYHRLFHFLLIICCLPLTVKAQNGIFRHINVENGLLQNSILAIAQDYQGFIWLGGRFGLNRYDGSHFRVYQSNYKDSTTLSFDYITSIRKDSRNILWIGTRRGLNRYDPEKDRFKRIYFAPPNDIENSINCISEDHNGILWIGTVRGLYKQSEKNPDQFLPVNKIIIDDREISLASFDIRAIYEDKRGVLWIGSLTGLLRLEQTTSHLRGRIFKPGGNPSINIDKITTIFADAKHQERLWIGTDGNGLYEYDEATNTFKTYTNINPAAGPIGNNIRTISADGKGRLWIGTLEGLTILDPATKQFTHFQYDPDNKQGLSKNSVYCIFHDTAGSVWIGTYFGGVNIADAFTTPFTVYQSDKYHSSISNNVVSSFAEDKSHHHLWIGTEGGGLNYFNLATGQFTTYKHSANNANSLSSNLIKTLFPDQDGNLWIGTHGGGLNVFTSSDKKFRQFTFENIDSCALTSEVQALLEDHQGRFWVGTENGIRLFTRKGDQLLPYQGSTSLKHVRNSSSVHLVYEDRQRNIWVATSRKLYLLKNGQTNFVLFYLTKDSSVYSGAINCIREDHQGRLWFGTYSTGLIAYTPQTSLLQSFTKKDGLPDNNILSIEEDNNSRLWLGSGNSLSCFDPQTGTCHDYAPSDGLMTGGFNYNSSFSANNGKLYFGGFNGFTGFSPSEIKINRYKAPLFFTSVDLFNKPVAINGNDGILDKDMAFKNNIRLKYNQNAFTINFALLNYIKSEKNRYLYKMDPVEKNWNEVTATSANYTGLPPGDYSFVVKGANNDGIWGEPTILHITILPPFWRTWWAYCIYIAAFLSILFITIRFLFLRELLKKENALHQAKLNFFTNISHEIRTHLALIIGPIEKMQLRERDDEDLRQLQYVKKNSANLLQLVGELMDFRKAESGNTPLFISEKNIVAFIKEVYSSFEEIAATRHIRLELVSSSDNIPLHFDDKQLVKVFVNLLSNAFKFTPDGGAINILTEEKKSVVTISVTDNGRGIAPQNLDKLFLNFYQENDYGQQNTGYGIGLALSKSIVELHKGQLTVESELGVRTCFTVTLPKDYRQLPLSRPTTGTAPTNNIPTRQTISALSVPPETFSVPAPPASNGEKNTVLLVEDNPDVRTFLRHTLEEKYNILESDDGLKGWDTATSMIPDLIISDVMMPKMDGYTLCGKLKLDERTSHIPLILLTAKTTTANQISGLEMGADIYLTKPFSIHVLELHMRNLLNTREKIRKKYGQVNITQTTSVEPTTINPVDEQFLQKSIAFIEENMTDAGFGVQMLATHMFMSQPILYKKIKALTDMSVNDFMKHIRLKKAASLLLEKQYAVYEVMYMVGYSDRKHFANEFKKMYNVTPGDYARQQ